MRDIPDVWLLEQAFRVLPSCDLEKPGTKDSRVEIKTEGTAHLEEDLED